MSFPAASRNRLVTLQRKTSNADSLGQRSVDWVDVAQVWANLRYLNGKEYTTAQTDVSKATVSIRLRYRADLDAAMRVLYRNTMYNIEAVLPDMQNRAYVDLACSTGANRG